MPYVSPRGAVKTTAPPRRQKSPPPEDPVEVEEPLEHAPSAELGEVNSRDRDDSVVEELVHWKGWGVQHVVTPDEKDDIDPLDPEIAPAEIIKVENTRTDSLKKDTKPVLSLVTDKKRVVRVADIEVDDRFISDDLL